MTDAEFQQRISQVPYARTLGIQIGEEDACFLLPVKKATSVIQRCQPCMAGLLLALWSCRQ